MKDVYKNSYCTIAATGASDSTVGCFTDRYASFVHAFESEIGWLGPSNGQWPTKGIYTWCDASIISTNVTDAPLTQRAWFVQERLLSPRVLHFGPQQMMWECQQMEACETFPQQVPDGMFSHGQKGILAQQKAKRSTFNKTWDAVIDSYTRCRLTIDSDKAVALSGIVQDLQLSFRDDCVAGLWRRNMAGYLLLRVPYDPSISPASEKPSRPATYRAPSWSWYSVDGPISIGIGYEPPMVIGWDSPNYFLVVITIKEIEVQHRGENMTGPIESGYMRVNGILKATTWSFVQEHHPSGWKVWMDPRLPIVHGPNLDGRSGLVQ